VAVQWGAAGSEGDSNNTQTGLSALHPGSAALRKRAGRKAGPVEDRPVEWLLRRTTPGPGLALVAALLSAAPAIAGVFAMGTISVRGSIYFGWFPIVPSILLAFAVARQAAGGLAVMQQSGFMEVLLTTPIRLSRIVAGQRSVFWRETRWVLVLVIASEVAPWIWQYATLARMNPNVHLHMGLIYGVTNVIQTLVYFVALLWLGMYFGYTKRKTAAAAGWTVLCAMVLPMFASSLFTIVWVQLASGVAQWFYYVVSLISFLVSISIYLGLIRWAQIKLLGKEAKAEKWPRVLGGWLSPRMEEVE
jgi:hypothetical protein